MRLLRAIRATARRMPHRVAVSDAEGSLTYAQLWAQAESVSADLSGCAGGLVLLQELRSTRLITRLLAIWMAGGVPLMLDPATPAGRSGEIVERCRPFGVFRVSGWARAEGDWRVYEEVEYAVTTSGSTGRPRVVLVGPGSLLSVAKQQVEAFCLKPDSKVLWMLSPGFDASLSDIATALLSGANLVCGGQSVGAELSDVLLRRGITHLDIPPAVLALYQPGDFPSTLVTLIVGGEASEPSRLRLWSRYHRVVAVYGPTETTVCSSLSVVDEDWDRAYIGQPLQGVEYRREGNELLIGGSHVAQGYLAEEPGERSRFFCDDGMRWYRTGDCLGEYHPRHGFQFVGRRDRQVKVRGQRLELDEIEVRARRALEQLRGSEPPSRVAVCLLRERVAIFWVGHDGLEDEERALRQALSQALVPGWLPLHYIRLAALPMTDSGKVAYSELERHLPPTPSSHLDSLGCLALALERGGPFSTPSDRTLCRALAVSVLKQKVPARPIVRRPKRESSRSFPERPVMLVTGGTGRLGRALSPLLRESFELCYLTRTSIDSRCFVGDLTLPDFGLNPDQWETLSREVDVVLNLAADLDLNRSLGELRSLNIDCLERLAQLGKPIHQASTLAVLLSASPASLDSEKAQPELIFGGYAQSKWVAERFLTRWNWPGWTFEYGQLFAEPSPGELLFLVIAGLLEMGCFPRVCRESNLYFDWTPTGWAAQQTLSYLLQPELQTRRVVSIRKGWNIHLLDLVESIQEVQRCRGSQQILTEVEAGEFFGFRSCSSVVSVAQRALFKGLPGWQQFVERRDFDLLLLGNGFQAVEPQALCDEAAAEMRRYVAAVMETLDETTVAAAVGHPGPRGSL